MQSYSGFGSSILTVTLVLLPNILLIPMSCEVSGREDGVVVVLGMETTTMFGRGAVVVELVVEVVDDVTSRTTVVWLVVAAGKIDDGVDGVVGRG